MQQNSGAYIILPPPQQAQHRFSSMNVVQTLFMPPVLRPYSCPCWLYQLPPP